MFKNTINWKKISIELNFGWAVLISVIKSITNNSWVSDKVKKAVTNRFSDSLEFKEKVTNKQVGIKNYNRCSKQFFIFFKGPAGNHDSIKIKVKKGRTESSFLYGNMSKNRLLTI